MNANRPNKLPKKQYSIIQKTRTPQELKRRKAAPNRVKRTEVRAKARQDAATAAEAATKAAADAAAAAEKAIAAAAIEAAAIETPDV